MEVEVGENLGVGQRVARVVDVSRIEVPLRLPASARSSLRLGDEVVLRSAGSGNETWRASVARIAPEDDQATRTMAVYAEVMQEPDQPGGLAPGQFLRGLISSSTNNLRWVIPRRALAGERIYLIENGRVVSRVVKIDFQIERTYPELGLADVQWVVLREPLQEGEQVVVNGSRSMSEGMAAQAVIAEASEAGEEDK